MRILVAGLIGGLVFFFWGAMAHMMLGLGDRGVHLGKPYTATLAAMNQELVEPGIHLLPSMTEDQYSDDAAIAAFAKETAGQGYAFVVYAPAGNSGLADMGPNLGKQWATDTLAALLLAWLLSLAPMGFGTRVAVAAVAGAFATIAVLLPMWNWYLFPLDYVMGNLAKHVLGWALAGAAMAWWLGRKR